MGNCATAGIPIHRIELKIQWEFETELMSNDISDETEF